MKVIPVIGQKGGTGKTTVAENLFVEAWANGLSAGIIDLDPQASSYRWANRRKANSEAVVSTQAVCLEQILKGARDQGMDICFLDTPARASDVSYEAARVADLVLVPARPFVTDMETLKAVRELLLLAGAPQAFVVVNAAPVQGSRHDAAKGAAEDLGLKVCPIVLHQRAAFADAPALGQGAREYAPSSPAALETEALFRFVMQSLNLQTLQPSNLEGSNGKETRPKKRAERNERRA